MANLFLILINTSTNNATEAVISNSQFLFLQFYHLNYTSDDKAEERNTKKKEKIIDWLWNYSKILKYKMALDAFLDEC